MKTRIMAGGQQVVRIDRESTGVLDPRDRDALLRGLEEAGPFSAVVVSDYGKGVVGEELMDLMRRWHDDGSVVVVDPKQGNFELYRGVSAITPNEKEAAGACHAKIEGSDDAARVGQELMTRLGTDMILLTRGENGICLIQENEETRHIPTEARQVFDVTGAGDTVIAGFTALLAAGATPELAARMANAAAGVAVATLGTATVDAATLAAAWKRRMESQP
jgi:rfaE bifunctional protein kinase chain/domain